MILADLALLERQAAMTPGLAKALEFLRGPGAGELPDGKYPLDGDRVFAIVQRYATAEAGEPRFEAHRAYLDVQYIARGAEIIGWAPAARLEVTEAYDAQKDICFGRVRGGWTPALVEAGRLAVLWPEDAHAPRLAAGKPAEVVKIVVKVAL